MSRDTRHAFSLIEIIITVALLSVIMLGLLLMFNQTQRAFQAGVTQVDVLESGRAAISMISRELQQVSPTYWSQTNWLALNSAPDWRRPNFACGDSLRFGNENFGPFAQPVPQSPGLLRTNYLHELFYILRENQKWIGVGYFTRVEVPPPFYRLRLATMNVDGNELGAGTLYRYQREIPLREDPYYLYTNFNSFRNDRSVRATDPRFSTNVSRLIEGVVHFKVTTYDTLGKSLTNDLANIKATNLMAGGYCFFFSNAVPAAVEIELGMLEDRVWQRYKAIDDTPSDSQARYLYLSNNVGRIHLFRQRVAVRNVDPTAYQ